MKVLIIICVFSLPQFLFSQLITLSDTTNQYGYIIITVPEFVSACEPFKQHKETVRNFNTLLVTTDQIYAEFDSSETRQDNIRDFISYAGTFWRDPKPKYVLFAGSVQFIPNFNIYNPIHISPYWQSDFYYKQNKYENDSTTTDFYVGRIPAKNTTELEKYFNKVIDYESNSNIEGWMNNSLFICEDDIGFKFLEWAMYLAGDLPSYIKPYLIFEKDTSAFFGNKDSIFNAINNRGTALVWFEGHWAESFFISPDYFNISDLSGLNNTQKYFVSIMGTQAAIIDTNTNISNELLYLDKAGSLGAICYNGLSYWGAMRSMQSIWAARLFDPAIGSLGEAMDLYSLPNTGILWYMKQVNSLWADPSLKLKFDTTVDVENVEEEIPDGYVLYQNYPNPFNPATRIKFSIQDKQNVTLKVFNILGMEITTLINEERPAGSYEVEFNGSQLASGIYFYEIQAGDFIQTKKMILLK